jgi:hypothetical protein
MFWNPRRPGGVQPKVLDERVVPWMKGVEGSGWIGTPKGECERRWNIGREGRTERNANEDPSPASSSLL